MSFDLREFSALSRLLDVAMALEPAQVDGWLATLPESERPLAPRLREMLAMNETRGLAGFLTDGPRFDAESDAEVGADGDAALVARAGATIGPYRLIRRIGSGGMGEVWLADRADGTFKREVALKLPRLAWGAGLAHRMARERDIGARLEHPHIARLYDAGVDANGRPYLALEYVDGEPIDAWCDARALDVRARLRLMLQVMQAVSHAHGRLVVHRDIKPSNVLVTADGQAHLLDFGIAKLLQEAASDDQLTQQVGRMLTPAYASPEQIRDEPLTVASDVYSLGVLLYLLLTGRQPFGREGASAAATFEAVLHAEATRPSRLEIAAVDAARRGRDRPARLASLLSGDLDTIVLKAIRKSPMDRYGSVERFAEDVQRYLAYTPIAARPPSIAHRLGLFARRHRSAIAMAAIGTTFAIVLAALLWQQHARTVVQSARADAVRDFMLDMVEDVEPDQAHAGQEITGRQMLHRGLARARDRFRNEPRTLGEVLSELYRMLDRLHDDAADEKLLAEAFDLLRKSAPDNDPALNTVRTQLADAAFDGNRIDQAVEYAQTALRACDTAEPGCAKARSYASALIGRIEARRGHVDESLSFLRTAVTETETGFGPEHAETAIAWYGLAVVARNAGRVEESGLAIARAQAINERVDLPARDHAKIALLQVVVLQDLGQFVRSRDLLTSMLKSSTERAEQSRLDLWLANAQLGLGEADAASASAAQALALTGPTDRGIGVLLIRQAQARALGLEGRSAEALAAIQLVTDGLPSVGFKPSSSEALRARRFNAEILARDGRYSEADELLLKLVDDLRSLKTVPEVELAQALDLLGCVRRLEGRPAEAIVLHEEAHAAAMKRLAPDHVIVLRNALYLALARWTEQPNATHRAAFEDAAARFATGFGPRSAWVRLIDLQRERLVSPTGLEREVRLIL